MVGPGSESHKYIWCHPTASPFWSQPPNLTFCVTKTRILQTFALKPPEAPVFYRMNTSLSRLASTVSPFWSQPALPSPLHFAQFLLFLEPNENGSSWSLYIGGPSPEHPVPVFRQVSAHCHCLMDPWHALSTLPLDPFHLTFRHYHLSRVAHVRSDFLSVVTTVVPQHADKGLTE